MGPVMVMVMSCVSVAEAISLHVDGMAAQRYDHVISAPLLLP